MHATELVKVLFAEQAVFTERETVVAGDDDEGVVEQTGLLQGFQDAPGLVIEITDGGVITGQFAGHVLPRARPGQCFLVADVHLAVVEWMQRQEIGRQRDVGRLVHRVVRVGRVLRVVRFMRRKIEEERFCAGVFLDEGDDVVGVALGGLAVHVLIEIHIQRVRVIAELAAVDGGISGGLDGLRQCGGVAACAQITDAGLDHRAARHADGAGVGAERVRVAEHEAVFHHAIQMRGSNHGIPERMQTIRTQIVREDEQDMGWRGCPSENGWEEEHGK